MYEVDDTIVAISSTTSDKRVIIRLSGRQAIQCVNQFFSPEIGNKKTGIFPGEVAIDSELQLDAKAYVFLSPYSYTGEDIVEIHLDTNKSVVQVFLERLLSPNIRIAEAGEFTARAYFNGKIDLAQAEAVNEIITSSNRFQLAAAEKLLEGKLKEITSEICSELMECMSLLEAGIDFSNEDIEFISQGQAVKRIASIKNRLKDLLKESIRCESVIDLPSVGIAAAPNAGKSSLLNKLLSRKRSIVSGRPKTTRDILTGELTLANWHCVVFDCAGLIESADNILDQLSQSAAIEALRSSWLIIFCVDISKDNFAEDIAVRQLIPLNGSESKLIAAATKADLLCQSETTRRLAELNNLFGIEFLPISSKTGIGIEMLKKEIDKKLTDLSPVTGENVTLTARHRKAVNEATANVDEAIDELKAGNDEVAAMLLRAAWQGIANIEHQHVDDQILENIFSRFCIGK